MHYYQFNIADYRKDTGHLTPVEHYIYRWLIDEYHLSEQPFNNNMTKLLRRMSLDENHRNSLELILDEFFVPACDNDYEPVDLNLHPEYSEAREYPELCQYWMHPRIEQDIDTYKKFIVNKSAAGKASAKARKTKKNTTSTPVEQNLTSEQLTTNHKPLTTNHKIKTKATPFVVPDWIDQDVWKAFVEHRQKLRAPMTDKAKALMVNKVFKLNGDSTQIFNQSIENGWKGVFEIKEVKQNGSHQQTNKPSLAERVTENRKRAEQQIDEQSMGKDGTYLRP